MNYHDLKVLHIFFAALTIAISSALFYGGSTKVRQITLGVASILLLATGFSILSRFGIKHSGPYPLWINVKIGVWIALTVATPIVAKRFPDKAQRLFWPWMLIALIAIAMAVYKPMV